MSFTINLEEQKIPKLEPILIRSQNYYLPSRDGKIFDELQYLYDNSSTHGAFIDHFRDKLFGLGLVGAEVTSDDQIIKKLKLNDTLKAFISDVVLFGAGSLEIIWNVNKTKITKINHLDVTKIRVGMVNEETDETEFYYYCTNWNNYKNRDVELIQAYNLDPNSEKRQIYYFKLNNRTKPYAKPYYYSVLKWIYTDIEISTYYSNLVKNNFVGNTIISINSGTPDPELQTQFEQQIKNKFTTSGNAGKIMVLYNDSKENEPTIQKFNNDADDQKYQWLSEQCITQLIIGHRTYPLLAGLAIPGKLGNRDEFDLCDELYYKNMVNPNRALILDVFNELNQYLLTPLKEIKINNI